MTTGGNEMSEHRNAKESPDISFGDSVSIVRELQELSQNELAELTSIPQSIILAIENNKVNLGIERTRVFARALECHPAVLVFPGWDAGSSTA